MYFLPGFQFPLKNPVLRLINLCQFGCLQVNLSDTGIVGGFSLSSVLHLVQSFTAYVSLFAAAKQMS